MRGRKRTPTSLKMLRGTYRSDRAIPNEPRPTVLADLEPPPDMPPEAAAHWRRLVPLLTGARVMTELDTDALRLLCDACMRYDEANAQLHKYGMVIKAPSGFPIQSPYLAIANKAHEQICKLLVEFGLSPSSRTRVAATPPPASDSPWARLKAQAIAAAEQRARGGVTPPARG